MGAYLGHYDHARSELASLAHSFINPIYRSHTEYACAVDDLYLHVCAHEQKYIAHGPRRVDHARARAHPG